LSWEAQPFLKQRAFIEKHLATLTPLAADLRRLSRGYTRHLIWEPDEGDWCIHQDPISHKSALKLVWMVCEYDESHPDPNHHSLIFRISFPENGYDEEIDEGEIDDCLWLPTVGQCMEWLSNRQCGVELVQVGDATQIRSVIGIPSIQECFPTPNHALMTAVLAVLNQPRTM